MDGLNILIDLVFNDYYGVVCLMGVKCYRFVFCIVDEFFVIDVVCISYNYYDYFDYIIVC